MKGIMALFLLSVTVASTDTSPNNATSQSKVSAGLFRTDTLINKAALRDRRKLWPHGRVPYVISAGFTRAERDNVARAMLEFHKHTCIRFVPRTNQRNYINIGKHGQGCSSYIGMTGGGQKVNLGNGCADEITVPMHELMHAIGFAHEQTRPDRDNFVRLFLHNVDRAKHHNFAKVSNKEFQVLTPYDYNSVMHYESSAFANGKTAMTRKDGSKQFGNNRGFTKHDVAKIRRLYRCR